MAETETKKKDHVLNRLKEASPVQLMVYMVLFGSGILFLFILIAYFATNLEGESLTIPRQFTYSTIILLFASLPVGKLTSAFDREKSRSLIKYLGTALMSAIIFIFLQISGWLLLKDQLKDLDRSADFLYLLSALHLVHIAVLILATVSFIYYFFRQVSDPIKKLILFTNPYERVRVKMISDSWLYLHALWFVVYLTFLIFG
jgi:cytochrome c oxidase subunit 3